MRRINNLMSTSKLGKGFTTAELLESSGYIKQLSSGCIAMMPLGKMVFERIATKLKQLCEDEGMWEVSLPLLQRYQLWVESGRAEIYGQSLCTTTIGSKQLYVVNPTQEETVLDLLRQCDGTNHLPVRLFQISERVRNETRPAHGLIRTRSFVLADLYCLTDSETTGLDEVNRLERIFHEFISWAGLTYHIGEYIPCKLGPRAFSYWTPFAEPQCHVYQCTSCSNYYRYTLDTPEVSHCCNAALIESGAAEIGDIMHSGTNLSATMNVASTNGPVFVSTAGIGLSRLLQILAGKNHDDKGLSWPSQLSPFDVHVVCAEGREGDGVQVCGKLDECGLSNLLDDRHMSLGRKLVDADLLGITQRIVIGKSHSFNNFEFRSRSDCGSTITGSFGEFLCRYRNS